MRNRCTRGLGRACLAPVFAVTVVAATLAVAPAAHAASVTQVQRAPVTQPSQMAGWYRSLGKTNHATVSIDSLAALFIQEGRDEGVAGDLAFAQAMVETGYLTFSTRMPASNNNFSGLGAVDAGTSSAAFPDARTGVRAQIQHLRAYADAAVTVATLHHPLVDTRFTLVSPKGKAPTWEQFGYGIWASAASYATAVLGVYAQLRTWAAAHPVLPFDPFTTATAVVKQGFSDLLYRQPSPAELGPGAQLIGSRAVTPPGYYSALVAGEARRYAFPVIRLYLAALGRGPDRAGLAYWSGQLRAGAALDRLASIFLASGEYRARVGQPADVTFVNQVYRDVLARPADTAGLAYWSGRLATGLSRSALLTHVSESSEHVNATGWIAEAVVVYLGMLARLPLLSDLAWWKAEIGTGAPVSMLVTRAWVDPTYRLRVGA